MKACNLVPFKAIKPALAPAHTPTAASLHGHTISVGILFKLKNNKAFFNSHIIFVKKFKLK